MFDELSSALARRRSRVDESAPEIVQGASAGSDSELALVFKSRKWPVEREAAPHDQRQGELVELRRSTSSPVHAKHSVMFDELSASLAARAATQRYDTGTVSPTFDDELPRVDVRHGSGPHVTEEAEHAAELRRQASSKQAEMIVAMRAGEARRQAAAKDARVSAVAAEVAAGRSVTERDSSWPAAARHRLRDSSRERPRRALDHGSKSIDGTDAAPPLARDASVESGSGACGGGAGSGRHEGATSGATSGGAGGSGIGGGPHPAVDAFAHFIAAKEAAEIQTAYDALLGSLDLYRAPLSKLCLLLAPMLPHRYRQLLRALEARAGQPQFADTNKPRGARGSTNALIIGAGPVGLRCAIELALLGAKVEVVEARERFSRLQVLHLWEWVEADLIELGIKLIDPSIFASIDVRRCSTAQMQHSLLKVALLLGCRVRFGTRVTSVESLAPLHNRRLDALVDASGARCELLSSLGFSQVVAFSSAQALCIVISLVNHRTPEELELRESTWSSQYYQAEFSVLQQAGVALENLVYYRSTGAFSDAA